jgi:hypothetical protein
MRVDSEIDPRFVRPARQMASWGAGAPFYVRDTAVPWASRVRAFAPVNHCCVFGVEKDRVSLLVHATAGAVIDEAPDLTAEVRRR